MFRILKIIKARWVLGKPNKKKILIYDRTSEKFVDLFFKEKNIEYLDVRYESINMYIIFITFFKNGILRFKDNYLKNFINFVSPKIVFTAIDNDPAFYSLKSLCKEPIYISVQNGMRNNDFYEECKKYIKKKKIKLKVDHIFLFGENEKKRFSKVIEGQIHCFGNCTNNHYAIGSRKINRKINSIMYISQYNFSMYKKSNLSINTFNEDKVIFNHLNKFCNKKKIKLSYCSKVGDSLEPHIRNSLAKGNWTYYPSVNKEKTYKNLNKQQMVVFGYSTLGFEALAKGLRCAIFYKSFPIEGSNMKYPKSGPFWTNLKNYSDLEKTLKRVIAFSNNNWKRIANKYSAEILNYNPANTKMKKIIYSILKNGYK